MLNPGDSCDVHCAYGNQGYGATYRCPADNTQDGRLAELVLGEPPIMFTKVIIDQNRINNANLNSTMKHCWGFWNEFDIANDVVFATQKTPCKGHMYGYEAITGMVQIVIDDTPYEENGSQNYTTVHRDHLIPDTPQCTESKSCSKGPEFPAEIKDSLQISKCYNVEPSTTCQITCADGYEAEDPEKSSSVYRCPHDNTFGGSVIPDADVYGDTGPPVCRPKNCDGLKIQGTVKRTETQTTTLFYTQPEQLMHNTSTGRVNCSTIKPALEGDFEITCMYGDLEGDFNCAVRKCKELPFGLSDLTVGGEASIVDVTNCRGDELLNGSGYAGVPAEGSCEVTCAEG